jgi:hypothetical protein
MLHCYKIILQGNIEQTQHQQRILQQASQYTVQSLEQVYQLAPENNNDSLSAIIRLEQRQERQKVLIYPASSNRDEPQAQQEIHGNASVILENACQGYEHALKLLELVPRSSCEDRGEQNAEYLRRTLLQDLAVRISECTPAHEASESQQRATHERRTLAIARLQPQDSLLLLTR